MKQTAKRCLLAAYLASLLVVPAWAFTSSTTITDELGQVEDTPWCIYRNLASREQNFRIELAWPNAPDPTASPIQSPSAGPGVALYGVESAQSMQIGLYSQLSTFATEQGGSYELGFSLSDRQAERIPLLRGAASGLSFLQTPENRWMELRQSAWSLYFEELSAPPAEATGPVGPSVECSPDGSTFTAVPLTRRSDLCSLETGGNTLYYYELFQAPVPSGTNYVRVSVREIDRWIRPDGTAGPAGLTDSMRLASVSFTGNNVRFRSLSGEASSGSESSRPPSAPSPPSVSPPSSPSSEALPSSMPPSGSSSSGSSSYESSRDPDLQYPSDPWLDFLLGWYQYWNKSSGSSRASSASSRTSSRASSRASSQSSSRVSARSSQSPQYIFYDWPSASAARRSQGAPEPSRADASPASLNASEAVSRSAADPYWDREYQSYSRYQSKSMWFGGAYLLSGLAVLARIAKR